MLYTNSGKILLTSIDLSTGVDGENDDGSDNSVYIPPPDDDSDLNRKYCPSDKDNDREDVFFDRKRILEELDPILVDPTDKNQLPSEEDGCCVKNVRIRGAKYIEKVEEFNSCPKPPK